MKLKLTQLVGVLLILVSCNNKPFSKVDFAKGDYVLYCYSHSFYCEEENNKDVFKYNNFYIDKVETLEKIKNEVIQEYKQGKDMVGEFYSLALVKDGRLEEIGTLNVKKDEYAGLGGKFGFDMEAFKKMEEDFKPLSAYRVNNLTIESINRFVDFVEKSKGFILNMVPKEKLPTYGFEGMMDLVADVSDFNSDFSDGNNWFKKAQKQIETDFDKIGNVKVASASFRNDSVYVSLYCKNDITDKLPKGYKKLKSYTTTIDFPIPVYNLSKQEIIDFFNKSGITDYVIDDMN